MTMLSTKNPVQLVRDFPVDAEIVYFYLDVRSDSICAVLAHKDFPPTPDGSELYRLPALIVQELIETAEQEGS